MRYKIWKKIFLQCTFLYVSFMLYSTLATYIHTYYVKAIWGWKHDAERFLWGKKKVFFIVRWQYSIRERKRHSRHVYYYYLHSCHSDFFLLESKIYIEIISRINRISLPKFIFIFWLGSKKAWVREHVQIALNTHFTWLNRK